MSLPTNIVNDFYLEVIRGNVTGFSAREIVGQNKSLSDTQFIWTEGTGQDLTEASAAAPIYVSSANAGDTNKTVTVTGVDANYDEITETITTNGQTPVVGQKSFLAVNSVTVSTALSGKLYVYYSSDVTSGVPDDLTKVQAVVDAGDLQAYNAFYCVPRNKNLYLTNLRYSSTNSTTAHNVILTVQKKVYGGSYTTVDEIKYTDPGTGYVDNQVDFMMAPVLFPAKSKFKMIGSLAGGTDLIVAVEAKFIEEDIRIEPAVTSVMNKATYLATLTARDTTITSLNYYLIGLDELPMEIPSSFNLNDTLAVISGDPTTYRVADDTEVAFDPAYFVSGKLVSTTKPALLTVMRCVDSSDNVDYVLAPVNTLVDLGGGIKKTMKISYLA